MIATFCHRALPPPDQESSSGMFPEWYSTQPGLSYLNQTRTIRQDAHSVMGWRVLPVPSTSLEWCTGGHLTKGWEQCGT